MRCRPASPILIALLAGLTAGCGEPPGPEPRTGPPVLDTADAMAICPVTGPVRLRRLDETAKGARLQPDPRMGPAQIVWRGDLNDDRLEDLLLNFPEACGNWGECPWSVLAGCEGEIHAELWGPEYALSLAVAEAPPTSTWKTVVRTVRLEAAGPEAAVEERLGYIGDAYELLR